MGTAKGPATPGFQVYDLARARKPFDPDTDIGFRTVFDTSFSRGTSATVGDLVRFADAATYVSPRDPCHLTWYEFTDTIPFSVPLVVECVSHVFPSRTLTLDAAVGLLMPARKRLLPHGSLSEMPVLPHYVVLRVQDDGMPVRMPRVELVDQFMKRRARVSRPLWFGAPLAWATGPRLSVRHPATYGQITMLALEPSDPVSAQIETVDELTSTELTLESATIYAAPTVMRRWWRAGGGSRGSSQRLAAVSPAAPVGETRTPSRWRSR